MSNEVDFDKIFDILDREKEAKIPVGGVFEPTGFIGAWQAAVYNSVWTEADLPKEDYPWDDRRPMGRGYRYYFFDYGVATQAAEDSGAMVKRPQGVWQFKAARGSILNFVDEEAAKRFSDPMRFEVNVSTLGAWKHRHELHFIALPALVSAIAKALGYEVPGFELGELLNPQNIFTDVLQYRMIGHPDAGAQESYQFSQLVQWVGKEESLEQHEAAALAREYLIASEEGADSPVPAEYLVPLRGMKIPWEYSILGQRRAMLWEARGESNFRAYTLKGTGTTFDTKSEKLSKCLSYLAYPWRQPLLARLQTVADPRVDATFTGSDGQVKRLTIPAIVEFFVSEEAAWAAAEKELAARKAATGVEAEAAGPTKAAEEPVPTGLTLPPKWAERELSVDDWKATVAGMKEEFGKKPPAVLKKLIQGRLDEVDYEATVDDFLAWWAEV